MSGAVIYISEFQNKLTWKFGISGKRHCGGMNVDEICPINLAVISRAVHVGEDFWSDGIVLTASV